MININIDEYIGYAKKNLKKIYENLSSDRLQEIDNDLYYSCTEHEHTFGLRYSIGLGLYSKDNESFKKFIEKCKEIRKDVLQSKDQKEDKDVLELRPNNPDKFYEKIKKDDIYFNSPVLEYIGTKEFVEKFLQCKNVDQDKIIKALINGYQWHNGQINTSTREEGRSWLPDVIEQLKEIQKQEGIPFSKLRIEHYIGWLDGCFKNLE